MLTFPAAVRILLCTQPVDMRRSFDGLAALVRDHLGDDPLSGQVKRAASSFLCVAQVDPPAEP